MQDASYGLGVALPYSYFHPPSIGHSKPHGQGQQQWGRVINIYILPKKASEYLLNNYLIDPKLPLLISEFIFFKKEK